MKKTGALWKLSVTTSLQAEDVMTELLGRLTGCAIAVYSNEETRITEASAYLTKRTDWNKSKIQALNDGLELIRNTGIELGNTKIELKRIRREDWSESWKKHFKPLEIGDRLLIKPSWIKRKPSKKQVVVVIDPGLSFGTGNHPTTSFCLHELATLQQPGKPQHFLDIGTGSGILAISAVKLGYKTVKAYDFDPEAVRVACENAAVNNVADSLHPVRKDITKTKLTKKPGFDVVCANLISNLLIAEKKRISSNVRIGGNLILAGILAREFHEVRKAFETIGFRYIRSKVEGEWESGNFLRVKK